MSNYRRAFVQNSYVFITFKTYNNSHILIDNIEILRNAFTKTKNKYNFEIFAISVLPDHIHLILKPEKIEEYPKIIYSIKFNFSIRIDSPNINLTESKVKKGEKGIWQRRYWEHTILSEEDLYKHIEYIHYNPVKHGYVNAVKDWEYSSFVKFVKLGWYDINWGNNNDIMKIQNMNCE